MTTTAPTWLHASKKEKRNFSGLELDGWIGEVNVKEISYWIENRRTDVRVKRWKDEFRRVPTDDELYELFITDPDLAIEPLAKNILLVGLRQPLIVSYDKLLLDGNRRYLAHRWLLRNGKPHERERFKSIRAWVPANKHPTEQVRNRIVAEFNFISDFKKNWSDFVKAKFLYEEHNNGYSYNELAEMYGGAGFGYSQIVELVKTFEVIEEFARTSGDQDAARDQAEDRFIWFQQLQRSYRDEIRNDEEFQRVVFDNIRQDNIEKTEDLKNLKSVRAIKDAWAQFRKGQIEEAHLIRKAVELQQKKNPDPDKLLAELNGRLDSLVSRQIDLDKASEETLGRFHELAELIPGQVSDATNFLVYVTKRIRSLKSEQLASLSEDVIRDFETAAINAVQQARSTRN